ncbi:MAG TPA: hypothetical protein VK570_10865, partial [Rubrivivax sp.]|nr:hypothetical protein [Rubrivivax sp.]
GRGPDDGTAHFSIRNPARQLEAQGAGALALRQCRQVEVPVAADAACQYQLGPAEATFGGVKTP